LNVIVTASGDIDPSCHVFQSGVPVLIVINEEGARLLGTDRFPPSIAVMRASESGRITPRLILAAINRVRASHLVLLEGGPRLLAGFFADSCMDEQFLTLSPQIAGRDDHSQRPGLEVVCPALACLSY